MDNLAEASLVDGIDVWGVRTLGQFAELAFNGSAGLDDRVDARVTAPPGRRRIWPSWWGRHRRGSRSRLRLPGPTTSC